MTTWICPKDGIENPLKEKRCMVCRHPNLPEFVVLQSASTGKEAEFKENKQLGRAVFTHKFADPDAQYASDLQFEIVRDEVLVAWMVRPLPEARNPTYYNGKPIPTDGAELAEDGVISIGRNKLRLKVRFRKN